MATTKPTKVLWIGLTLTPELEQLKDEGHTVHTVGEFEAPLESYDLIMGPNCWRIGPQHMKFLQLAVKEARAAMPKRVKKK